MMISNWHPLRALVYWLNKYIMNIQGHSVKRFDEKRGRKAPVGSFWPPWWNQLHFLQAALRRASFPLQRVCHHCVIPQLPKITNPRILSHSLLNSNQAKTANGRSWSARSMGMKSTIRLHCAFSACNYFILPPTESQQSFRSWSSLHPKIPRMQDIFPGRTQLGLRLLQCTIPLRKDLEQINQECFVYGCLFAVTHLVHPSPIRYHSNFMAFRFAIP